jgi:streptogramin lyase
VERIDPETNEVEFRAELGGNINGITEGLGGIWVTDTGQGRIYKIDPEATGVAP